MFTGIVEEAGQVIECLVRGNTARLAVRAPLVFTGARVGDSIAINGCCLTVSEAVPDETILIFDAVPETLERTNLGTLGHGSRVNLERPLAVGDRLGGHFVQGHVDGVGTIEKVTPEENALVMDISAPESISRYIVHKGSVTVDGVSLTVAELKVNSFSVWIIPHTRAVTTLGDRKPGDSVNIECDLLGKYVERLLENR